MKILYFDTETTGLDPIRNDIIDLSLIIEIGGEVKHEESFKMQPFDYTTVEQGALDTHGMTVEQMKTFENPVESYRRIVELFGKYVNKYDKADRFYPAGYNCQFDINFLVQLFKKADPTNKFGLGSWIKWCLFDMMQQLRNEIFLLGGNSPYDNFKLSTVAAKHGIELKAHDALSDIRATRELIQRYMAKKRSSLSVQ